MLFSMHHLRYTYDIPMVCLCFDYMTGYGITGLELRIWKGKAIFKKGTLDFEGHFG